MTAPVTRRDDVVETLHGHQIADPYRWLEDPDSTETRAWVDEQRAYAEEHLATLGDRDWFAETMRTVVGRPRAGIPRVKGGWFFLNRNDGTQSQDVWHVADSLDGIRDPKARIIADPNGWSADGTTSLMLFTVSPDGRHLAEAVSKAGSDWQHITIVDVATGEPVDEPVLVTKFAEPTWLPDSRSYLYNAFDDTSHAVGTDTGALGRPRVMRHVLGTPQDDDVLVAEHPDERVLFDWGVTDDDHWLWIAPRRGTENRNQLWVHALDGGDITTIGPRIEIAPDAVAEVEVIGAVGEGAEARLYVRTDLDAPRGRVGVYGLDAAARGEITLAEIVAEQADTLVAVVQAGEFLLAEYLVDATSVLRRISHDGDVLGEIELPAGAIVGIDGSPDRHEAYVGVSTVSDPTAAYAVDVTTGSAVPLALVSEGARVAPPYVVERRRATSKDGTQVPFFLITPEGASGERPVLLYGYGGFKISVAADYRAGWPAWLAAGGTLAIANLRGGGEFGTDWYDQGRGANKQNVFDDFIAVAEDLVASQVTTPGQLAIHGRSNGGLLVGAAMTQRPDLFGAALPAVGVLDLLRFHLFTIGSAWISDYGDPDVAEEFEAALAYSPVHNVRSGVAYPPTLVATGDHDDRVVPAHSHKFTATVQASHAGDAPIISRIEVSTGHGAGKPTAMMAAEWADLLSFAAHHTGLRPPQRD